MKTKIKSRK